MAFKIINGKIAVCNFLWLAQSFLLVKYCKPLNITIKERLT